MAEFEAVNEEVLDAMAELTNMIIGSFKTNIEERLGPMGLSIPTVIYGRNFTTRSLSRNDWTLVPFECEEGGFNIHVCLAPNVDHATRRQRPGYSELQEISG
jgi:chemotaxis protein CheX